MGLDGLQVAAEIVPITSPLLDLLESGKGREAQRYWIDAMGGMTHVAHARQRIGAGQVDPALAEERLGITLDYDIDLQGVKA